MGVKYVLLFFGKVEEEFWLLLVLVFELMKVEFCEVMVYVGLIN